MLVLRRKAGEAIVLNGVITIHVLAVEGERVKLGISAPPEVVIVRSELLENQGGMGGPGAPMPGMQPQMGREAPRPYREETPRPYREEGARPYRETAQEEGGEGGSSRGREPGLPGSPARYGYGPRGRAVGDRGYGERTFAERPYADRPYSERPFNDRPYTDRPYSERPFNDRPFGERTLEERPSGDSSPLPRIGDDPLRYR